MKNLNVFIIFYLLLVVSVTSGCISRYEKYYINFSPDRFQSSNEVFIVEYNNCDISKLYEDLFIDYMVIGGSSFTGTYENPKNSRKFAKSIGADIILSTKIFEESVSGTLHMTYPKQQTQNHYGTFSGNYGYGTYSGTSTSSTNEDIFIPYTETHYRQNGFFLKNVNNIKPLFEKTKYDYPFTEKSKYDGFWRHDGIVIEIYKSNYSIVGINKLNKQNGNLCKWKKRFCEESGWSIDDVRFVFYENGEGIYLSPNRQPYKGFFSINNFGLLQVDLECGTSQMVQYQKM